MERVLCAVDLSDQSAELVKRCGVIAPQVAGSLTVLHVVPTFDAMEMHGGGWFDPVAVVYAPPREEVVARLRQVVAASGVRIDQVDCRVEAGEPAQTIIDTACALGADVIALATRERHDRDGQRLGSVAESVLRRGACDVLTVPPGSSAAPRPAADPTIVCAVDFSPEAPATARVAFELAGRLDARVLLVHVIDWPVAVELPDDVDFNVSDFRARLVYNAQQRLDAVVAAQAPAGCAVRTRIVVGRPSRELLHIADETRAALIVVGRRADGLRMPFAGSTIEQLVRGASCPVFTVKSTTTAFER